MSGAGLVFVSAVITIVPVLIYIWVLWVIDRYEKEPLSLLGVALLGGAVVAPALTAIIERVLGLSSSLFPALFQIYPVVRPNLTGAVIEELTKGAVILGAYHFLRREYDDTLDGIVYGATVGAGFALAESVLFIRDLVPHAANANFDPGFFFAIFMSGLTHCVFGAAFGATLGYVRETSATGGMRVGVPLVGLVAAVLYHLGYVASAAAGLAGIGGMAGMLLGLGRQVADWAGLVMLGFVVAWAWSRERGILRWGLADETGTGAITADELSTLTGTGRLVGGKSLREALAELAFSKWRKSRGFGTDEDVKRQRQRVLQLRSPKGGER